MHKYDIRDCLFVIAVVGLVQGRESKGLHRRRHLQVAYGVTASCPAVSDITVSRGIITSPTAPLIGAGAWPHHYGKERVASNDAAIRVRES